MKKTTLLTCLALTGVLGLSSTAYASEAVSYTHLGGNYMISYEPFWQTIRRKNISTYQLIYEYGILPDTIQRLRSGKTITTKTLNTLCSVIDCPISDILIFIPDEESR